MEKAQGMMKLRSSPIMSFTIFCSPTKRLGSITNDTESCSTYSALCPCKTSILRSIDGQSSHYDDNTKVCAANARFRRKIVSNLRRNLLKLVPFVLLFYFSFILL